MTLLLPSPNLIELPESTQASLEYVANGFGLVARSLTLLFAVLACRYLVELVLWCCEKWRRIAVFVALISIVLAVQKVSNYLDTLIIWLTLIRAFPYTYIFEPLSQILSWLVDSWETLTTLNDSIDTKYL